MPDTEINVVNRPERVIRTVLKPWPIAAAVVPAVVTGALWLVHLEGKGGHRHVRHHPRAGRIRRERRALERGPGGAERLR